jgi:cAMP-dependent protein kinase regulator
LLYNAPRAATIVAKTDCTLFKIDRGTFNHVITESTIKKRERFEDLIKSITLLDTLDPYEQQLLIDAFKEEKYKSGDFVMKEGDEGDKFYFVEKGEAVALKLNSTTGKNEQVLKYSRGGHFGEIALLNKCKRQASIQATSDLVLMSVDKKSFNRILGPLDILLRRNVKRYKQFVKGEDVEETPRDQGSQSDLKSGKQSDKNPENSQDMDSNQEEEEE